MLRWNVIPASVMTGFPVVLAYKADFNHWFQEALKRIVQQVLWIPVFTPMNKHYFSLTALVLVIERAGFISLWEHFQLFLSVGMSIYPVLLCFFLSQKHFLIDPSSQGWWMLSLAYSSRLTSGLSRPLKHMPQCILKHFVGHMLKGVW